MMVALFDTIGHKTLDADYVTAGSLLRPAGCRRSEERGRMWLASTTILADVACQYALDQASAIKA